MTVIGPGRLSYRSSYRPTRPGGRRRVLRSTQKGGDSFNMSSGLSLSRSLKSITIPGELELPKASAHHQHGAHPHLQSNSHPRPRTSHTSQLRAIRNSHLLAAPSRNQRRPSTLLTTSTRSHTSPSKPKLRFEIQPHLPPHRPIHQWLPKRETCLGTNDHVLLLPAQTPHNQCQTTSR